MKFRAYAFFFVLFGVLPDVVICLATDWPLWGKVLPFVPTLLAGAYLWRIWKGVQYTESLRVFSYLTFIFEFPKFIFILLLALSPGVAAVAGIGVSLFFSVMIFHVTTHLKTVETTLPFRTLPRAFDGLRVCQLTDFHLGSFGKANPYIRRIVDAVLATSPDLILFTGDLVNFDSHEADGYLGELARLKAPLGVWAIRGNHDYLLHGHHNEQERIADTGRLLETERALGWKLLLNEAGGNWTDGLVEVSIQPGCNHFKGMSQMMHIFKGDFATLPGIISRRFRKMTITPLGDGRRDWVEADGEIPGTLPLTVEVTGQQINIIIP